MFKSVLVVEDHESTSISVRKILEELGIETVMYAYYCDDALTKLRNALSRGEPYELMITDLSFEEDEWKQNIRDGGGLITAARSIQPGLKVLVFSAEKKPAVIESLFDRQGINGYVSKARKDAEELKLAIDKIYSNRHHKPGHLREIIRQKNSHQFSEYDITIISLLSQGLRQKDIPGYLQDKQIRPSGLSSIEKRLNLIKGSLGFSQNEQLVAFCKDMGII
jgi:two-component system capsular synthesis response regulator RcsB